jgi:3-hydroxyisobutyrate dehydrogenase-like beta-hydroxyacid dehydrogenase
MDLRVGVIGVGTMGRGIVENLLRAGFQPGVYDLRREVLEEMRRLGALPAATPAELARRSDVLLLVVPDEKAVKSVLFGAGGAIRGAAPGVLVVDMTTSDPCQSRPTAQRLAKQGVDYISATMTGGASGARAGRILLMVGGPRKLYERCRPVFRAISKRAIHVGGGVDHGHIMKLIHNHVSHAVYAATCEAVVLGQTLGLAIPEMMEVFNEGNARSYASEVRFPKFIQAGTPMGATFDIVYKDMSLVRKLAKRAKIRAPINGCTYRYWRRAVQTGRGREDWAAAMEVMREMLAR